MPVIRVPVAELGKGGWAEFRDKLNVRGRQMITAIAMGADPETFERLNADDVTPDDMALGLSVRQANVVLDVQSATIVAALIAWSSADPLPTMETIGDMDIDLYDALLVALPATTVQSAAKVDLDPSMEMDDRPTGRSGASNGHAVAKTPKSIPVLANSTQSTDSAA